MPSEGPASTGHVPYSTTRTVDLIFPPGSSLSQASSVTHRSGLCQSAHHKFLLLERPRNVDQEGAVDYQKSSSIANYRGGSALLPAAVSRAAQSSPGRAVSQPILVVRTIWNRSRIPGFPRRPVSYIEVVFCSCSPILNVWVFVKMRNSYFATLRGVSGITGVIPRFYSLYSVARSPPPGPRDNGPCSRSLSAQLE